MDQADIKKTMAGLAKDIDAIVDPHVASVQKTLLNLVEVLVEANASLKKLNQSLKDENNRLKGEQGQPTIRPQKKGGATDTNISSDADRKKRGEKKPRKKKGKKKQEIKIDKHIVCEIDKTILPPDAEYKGMETRVIQDLNISTNNIEFSVPVYYSPSLKKTFLASLPEGYQGEFGPGIRSLVITLYRDSGMTQPAIRRLLKTFNIRISKSTISRMLTDKHDVFHQEKEDIIDAGLKATPYQHIDDTGSRVNGINHYTHILCNPFFTAFFTQPKKDRLTLLGILCRSALSFEFNPETYALMAEFGLPKKVLDELKTKASVGVMTRDEIELLLEGMFPKPKKHKTNRRVIREASALIYYKNSEHAIEYLMCDDAPQFNLIAKYKSLCWVHEGRHYKKLSPFLFLHQKAVADFLEKFWDYYQKLIEYKKAPFADAAVQLSEEFDALFSIKTGYDALDNRIEKTRAKKKTLLLVLSHPFLPIHNNPAELGARFQARIRDINLQTISESGTKAKDTFATIVLTARKLGVNIYQYIYDRVTKKFEMPSLANLITMNAKMVLESG